MTTTKYTEAVLSKKTKPDLLEIAEELSIEIEDPKINKMGIVQLILEAYEADSEEEDEDDEEDDELDDIAEPELDDDEEDDEEQDEVVEVEVKKTSKKKTAKPASDDNTLAAKQVAALVGTDAKTIRQFFRSAASTVEPVGSGGRYEFLETDVPKIKEEFAGWSANRGKRGAGGGGKSSKKARQAAKVEETIEEVEEIEELEEADLEDLDDDELELDD